MTLAAVHHSLATVLVEPSFDLPLVSISVAVRLGALGDPPGAEGATRLMARLMRRSGGGRSAEQIDIEIDSLGGALSADVSASTMAFQGTVIARSLPRFGELLAEVVARPSLNSDELARLKRETEAELIESLDDDRTLARRWFRRKLFAGHAYGRSVSGTTKSIATAASPELVRSLYERLIVPSNLVIGCAGHITENQAHALADTITAGLASGDRASDDTEDPTAPEGRRLVIVDKPERTQTQIMIGGLGSHPHDPDHYPLVVANTAFGGTFTARLMQEVRSKRGWSYGAYSSLPYVRRRQAFFMWTFPKASDAAECIKLELQLLEKWREKGITKSELGWSKRYLSRSHAFAIDTASKRLGLTLDAELYGLPPGYYERYLEHIKNATLEQANDAIRQRISSDNLLLAVVGTESEIGESVRGAIPNLAHHEIVRYDAE